MSNKKIRADLVTAVALATGQTKIHTNRILNALWKELSASFEDEGAVSIDNFGRFITSRSAPRIGRDFQTGDTINIPSRFRTRFVISESRRGAINEMTA